MISIHAPAWGATKIRVFGWVDGMNFNPRSRVGSDRNPAILAGFLLLFQSTLPRGERPSGLAARPPIVAISIHAPAWGATPAAVRPCPKASHFNPRSRVGSDVERMADSSTVKHFNPRSRVGSDVARDGGCGAGPGFQSTLPRGERPAGENDGEPMGGYFNPRSRVGSDYERSGKTVGAFYFNPRSRVGSDGKCIYHLRIFPKFQSTLPRGERLRNRRISPV